MGTTFGPMAAAATMSIIGDAGLYAFLAAILSTVALSVGLSFATSTRQKAIA